MYAIRSYYAYEGHYFWDSEIYLMPFLIYTAPRIAKNLLLFRYNMLDQARTRARELSHRGAMFPWRTISGEEASAYYAAGTAQYHINADIVFALRKYVDRITSYNVCYTKLLRYFRANPTIKDDSLILEYDKDGVVANIRINLGAGF